MSSDWYNKSLLILGCGNVLFGDDGFGPAVAHYIQNNFTVNPDICVLDTGTSVRNVLFDVVLSDKKPAKIIILDAMDCGREPGELFTLDLDDLPEVKIDDFSFHQLPTSNLLRELQNIVGVEIVILACQVAYIPDRVKPGLSSPVAQAVEHAVEMLSREHFADFDRLNSDGDILELSSLTGEGLGFRFAGIRDTTPRYRRKQAR